METMIVKFMPYASNIYNHNFQKYSAYIQTQHGIVRVRPYIATTIIVPVVDVAIVNTVRAG